ncbi:MAG TPA: 6-pyruvoyl tetrahydrobiopterin synthase [Flavobacteriales bacterium]|nr:6-pyruvoyl tetrahydrobiopterin synthase [Flavobacteriales bacterium]|tara:strand:- start:38145 stop:38564 length:420 start_codon:yes stop_codon:yes gene_type:complete
MIYLTRRERFNAAHKLYKEEWSEEENLAFFGGCANPNWHGHNYELFVTVKGEINPETGFVVDLKKLSKLINDKIIAKVDHKNLNLDVPFLQGMIASTENLAVAVWNELEKDIAELGAQLHCIEIKETENNTVKYYGQNP